MNSSPSYWQKSWRKSFGWIRCMKWLFNCSFDFSPFRLKIIERAFEGNADSPWNDASLIICAFGCISYRRWEKHLGTVLYVCRNHTHLLSSSSTIYNVTVPTTSSHLDWVVPEPCFLVLFSNTRKKQKNVSRTAVYKWYWSIHDYLEGARTPDHERPKSGAQSFQSD